MRAAEAAVRIGDGRVVGELRVGVPFREGPPLMSSAPTGVRRRHPGVQVTLAATHDGTGADEVRRGHLDLVIMSRFGADAGTAETGLHQVAVGRDPLRLCVPDHHRLAGATECPVSELSAEPWVLGPATPLGRLILGLCAVAGFEPSIAATVPDVAAALGLVDAGWGVTIAPALTPAGRDGCGLRRIPLCGVDVFRHHVLLMRAGEERSPSIAAVVAAVQSAGTEGLS
ncbi:LysR family transcriptional regulator substrate-binding protein [Amycolatopsis sp. NBC_01480]|uniref:LysR family transcriptional regulator substrate-binding protein n=1 Tax=Amycolatopsis sp. NBC_01480 TaxID=2903562 RepID=UPI002E28D58D|nr:LysR family transcriptional regulator substrate-binding protein [Amycolatopsis sp. NBC_01480]